MGFYFKFLFFKKVFQKILFYVNVLPSCMPCFQGRRPLDTVESSGTRVIDDCESPYRCQDLKTGLLKEQPVLFFISFLQLKVDFLKIQYILQEYVSLHTSPGSSPLHFPYGSTPFLSFLRKQHPVEKKKLLKR